MKAPFSISTLRLPMLALALTSLFNGQLSGSALRQADNQAPNGPDLTSTVMRHMTDYYSRGVQEKIYLQTDKPYYIAGDTIWFKGHLANSFTHADKTPSNYIYAELVDGRDSLITRVMVKRDSLGALHSYIPLPTALQQGDYLLRSYTRWMMNFDNAFFFRQAVRVANPVDQRLQTYVTYEKKSDGTIFSRVTMYDSEHKPMDRARVLCKFPERRVSRNFTSNEKGNITIPLQQADGRNHIELEITHDGYTLNKTLQLPDFSTDFDLQFFPEGGPLLSGVNQKVAFKATGTNGLAVDVSGDIYDREGNVVASIRSHHYGMGNFVFKAAPGMQYTAKVAATDGVKREFALPVPQNGYALQVYSLNGRRYMEVLRSGVDQKRDLAVVAHAHGMLCFVADYTPGTLKTIPAMPEGITTLTLVDRNTLASLSERLIFIPDNDPATIQIQSDKQSYGPRSKVNLDLKFTDAAGNPVQEGQFAISVTDNRSVTWDGNRADIRSYMLLSSDLKGYVENPGYYFNSPDADRLDNLDLLLLTQGWRRFVLDDILSGKAATPYIYGHEEHQSISGGITNLWGKDARGASVFFFTPNPLVAREFELGDSPNFTLDDLDFPEGTRFSIQAKSRSGNLRNLNLEIHPEVFPDNEGNMIPVRRISEPESKTVPSSFTEQALQDFLGKGGERMIRIDSVFVSAPRKPVEEGGEHPWATHSKQAKDFEYFMPPGGTILDALRSFPGVQVLGDQIFIRGGAASSPGVEGGPGAQPTFVVDGSYFLGDLREINMVDVASIHLISGAGAAIYGFKGWAGVIEIYLKKGQVNTEWSQSTALKFVNPTGYRPDKLFYQPKYDVTTSQQESDLRTTIYWNPDVRPDSKGQARVSFYTADKASGYDVIVEGITTDGKICRTTAVVAQK